MQKIQLFTIPNLMTSGNLLCGCLGIVSAFRGDLLLSGMLVFLAAVLDFGDGFVARLLKQSSPIGKELDSLADCVTFGVLPSMILFQLLEKTNPALDSFLTSSIAFVLAIFSALRLAKFNIDTRQTDSFIGVPTPANAILVASLPFIMRYNAEFEPIILNQLILIAYILLMSFLLVSELPLIALKFKHYGWQGNQVQYIFLAISVVLLIFKRDS